MKFEFSRQVLNDMLLRKIKQHFKKKSTNYTGFSVSRTVLFGQDNKNSNFHNFLPDLHNITDKLLPEMPDNQKLPALFYWQKSLAYNAAHSLTQPKKQFIIHLFY